LVVPSRGGKNAGREVRRRASQHNLSPGAKLPASVLEKFYHANAKRLIPGLAPKIE
jgi:hypothetical protein